MVLYIQQHSRLRFLDVSLTRQATCHTSDSCKNKTVILSPSGFPIHLLSFSQPDEQIRIASDNIFLKVVITDPFSPYLPCPPPPLDANPLLDSCCLGK